MAPPWWNSVHVLTRLFCARQWLFMVKFGACAYTSLMLTHCRCMCSPYWHISVACAHTSQQCSRSVGACVLTTDTFLVHVILTLAPSPRTCSRVFDAHTSSMHVFSTLEHSPCTCLHILNAHTSSMHVFLTLAPSPRTCSRIFNAHTASMHVLLVINACTQSMHVLAHLSCSHSVNACVIKICIHALAHMHVIAHLRHMNSPLEQCPYVQVPAFLRTTS